MGLCRGPWPMFTTFFIKTCVGRPLVWPEQLFGSKSASFPTLTPGGTSFHFVGIAGRLQGLTP